MHRLLVFAMLLSVCRGGLVRVPKIYNALITSDENLSPSQAYPILEPVLRTTALGVAFPPLIVHPHIHNIEPTRIPQENGNKNVKEEVTKPPLEFVEELDNKKTENQPQPQQHHPQLAYHGSLYPLAFDPYLTYGYHHDFLYPTLPFYQHPVFVDLGHYESNRKADKDAPSPPKPAINFKKNPEIPDVLPPLPIKDERKRKS